SPSGETDQDSARLGASFCPGIGFTTASCRAYSIMNGVMIPGVSAGSNQVGASETCTPQVSLPCGAPSPAKLGAAAVRPSAALPASRPRRLIAKLGTPTA